MFDLVASSCFMKALTSNRRSHKKRKCMYLINTVKVAPTNKKGKKTGTQEVITRLHINSINLSVSSKKSLQIRLPCIIFKVPAENGLHVT